MYTLLFALQKTHCKGIVITFRTPSLLPLRNSISADKARTDCRAHRYTLLHSQPFPTTTKEDAGVTLPSGSFLLQTKWVFWPESSSSKYWNRETQRQKKKKNAPFFHQENVNGGPWKLAGLEKKYGLLKEAGKEKNFRKGTCNPGTAVFKLLTRYSACLGKIIEYEAMILLHRMQDTGCYFFTGWFKDMVCPKEKMLEFGVFLSK